MRHPQTGNAVSGVAEELPAAEASWIKRLLDAAHAERFPIYVSFLAIVEAARPARGIYVHSTADAIDFPERARRNELRRREETALATPLRAGLHHAAVRSRQVDRLVR